MKPEQRHTQLDLCIPYVLGRLTSGNRKQFEAHLKTGCAECSRELAELQDAMSLLPLITRQQTPPARVKEKVLASLSDGGRPAQRAQTPAAPVAASTQRPWFGYAIAAIFLFVVIILGVYTNDLIEAIGAKDQQIVELQDELQRKEAIVRVLQSTRIDMVLMSGQEASPAAYGKIIWDPAKNVAILQVSNLPTVPHDKDYQLWIIKNKQSISAGVFAITTEKEQEAFFKVMDLAVNDRKEIEAFAVTLEPKGGAPQPTGKMYLLGSVSSN